MKIILSIIVALGLPAAFWTYYMKESPEVQYSLSAAIPIAFPNDSKDSKNRQVDNEFVQQIEVANSGKGLANKIVVKIPRTLTQYSIAKHTANEVIEVFNSSQGFELNYQSLPPSTKFQITLKTSGSPLIGNQLEVFHQGGGAKIVSPGSRSKDFSIWDILLIFTPIIYIFLSYGSFRDELKYSFVFRRYNLDVDNFLQGKKPWYIRQKDWPEIMFDLVARALEEPIAPFRPISLSPSYKLLKNIRPEEISQDKWEKLRETASTKLIDLAEFLTRQYSSSAEILDLLNCEWPINLNEAKRVTLTNLISRAYYEKLLTTSTPEGLVKIVSENNKPSKISIDTWETFKRKAKETIAVNLAKDLVCGENPDSTSNSPAWNLLPYFEKVELQKLQEGRIAAANVNEKSRSVELLNERLNIREQELKIREIELSQNEIANTVSREKIYRQLTVIDNVITNPAYLDRIEPEDETFVKGNWNLLRKLALKNS